MTHALAALLTVPLIAGFGCGSPNHDSGGSGDGRPPLGAPIGGLTAGSWNWVPFPDSTCSDGSSTGVGVNPGTGQDVVFFLDGGGACASAVTCFVLHTATLGPFGATEFAAETANYAGSILDRALPANPFADATLVYVPYCTGDVHGGDRVVIYTDGPGGTMHHTGHTNIVAYLKRLAATYPTPRRLVIAGASAGGFGSLANYETFRNYFPDAQGILIDDSGPPLESDGGPLIQAGFQNWGIADVLDPLCGGAGVCEADLSKECRPDHHRIFLHPFGSRLHDRPLQDALRCRSPCRECPRLRGHRPIPHHARSTRPGVAERRFARELAFRGSCGQC